MQELQTHRLIQDLGCMYPTEISKEKKRYGLYLCSCGKEFKAQTQNVKNKLTTSCGCFKIKNTSILLTKHKMCKHKFYYVWASMIQRCINIKNKYYKNYGGRGICVYKEWEKFENFKKDMYLSYKEGLSIDRINNNGNYEPSNCRLATKITQQRNTRILKSDNTSGYRGVDFCKNNKKWRARIVINAKEINLGRFNTAEEAGYAYDKYVIDNNLEHTTNGLIERLENVEK